VVTTTVRSWECRWVTFLDGGTITVEGPFSELPNQETILAITGGTGKYRQARGQMVLSARTPDETEFDFIFQLASSEG
jgi:allene oxide cyclase